MGYTYFYNDTEIAEDEARELLQRLGDGSFQIIENCRQAGMEDLTIATPEYSITIKFPKGGETE